MTTQPNLFSYLSPTKYLTDLMLFRKSQNPGFTFESWASELGFKSRSFMNMIINKERNITDQFINVFSHSMDFTSEEKLFFSNLVKYSQSDSETERAGYLDRLLEIQGRRKDLIEIKNHNAFLATPFLPKLLVLLSFHDLDRSVEGLAQFLEIDIHFVTDHLEQLYRMQLASVNSKGQWVSIKKSFKVPKNIGSKALQKYHTASLYEAIEAQKTENECRRFRSLLVPLSESDYQNLLNDIEILMGKIVAKYDSDTLSHKGLYKFNLNLFPVTKLYRPQSDHKTETETRLYEKKDLDNTEV